jgi:hypothetical protein
MWFMESEELNTANYCYSTALDDRVFRECYSSEIGIDAYVNVEPEGEWNPINYGMLMREQRRQEALWRLPEVDPRRYSYLRFGESELVCYQALGAPNFAMMIPEAKQGKCDNFMVSREIKSRRKRQFDFNDVENFILPSAARKDRKLCKKLRNMSKT